MTQADAGQLTTEDGCHLHYEAAGAGHPVVLTHDGFLHSETWDAQFAALARRHRVTRWDRRGYGRSDRPVQQYSSVDDLAMVLRSVAKARASLVGCSYGSLVSLCCTLDHPELVDALVLVGPIVGGLSFSEHYMTRGGRRPPRGNAPVDEQIGYWSRTDPWIVAPHNTAAQERVCALLSAYPNNLEPKSGVERRPAPALDRLGEIAVPTLILVGEHDIADVHAHAGALEAGIPGAVRHVLPGSGHLPQLETPDEVNRLLLDFLPTPA